MQKCRFAAAGVFGSVLVLALGLGGAARALDEVPWDQARATELATKLAAAVDELYRAARVEQLDADPSKSAENYTFLEDMKMLRRTSSSLARYLEKGSSKEQTSAIFDRLLSLVRQARESRRYADMLKGAQPQIDAARALADELARFYGTPPTPDPTPAD
jgi:uncharacterized membrane protein YccC